MKSKSRIKRRTCSSIIKISSWPNKKNSRCSRNNKKGIPSSKISIKRSMIRECWNSSKKNSNSRIWTSSTISTIWWTSSRNRTDSRRWTFRKNMRTIYWDIISRRWWNSSSRNRIWGCRIRTGLESITRFPVWIGSRSSIRGTRSSRSIRGWSRNRYWRISWRKCSTSRYVIIIGSYILYYLFIFIFKLISDLLIW